MATAASPDSHARRAPQLQQGSPWPRRLGVMVIMGVFFLVLYNVLSRDYNVRRANGLPPLEAPPPNASVIPANTLLICCGTTTLFLSPWHNAAGLVSRSGDSSHFAARAHGYSSVSFQAEAESFYRDIGREDLAAETAKVRKDSRGRTIPKTESCDISECIRGGVICNCI